MSAHNPKGILIKLDAGLRQLIHREIYFMSVAASAQLGRPAKLPRTAVMRSLMLEAIKARAAARGEMLPEIEPVDVSAYASDEDEPEASLEPVGASEPLGESAHFVHGETVRVQFMPGGASFHPPLLRCCDEDAPVSRPSPSPSPSAIGVPSGGVSVSVLAAEAQTPAEDRISRVGRMDGLPPLGL